MVRGLPISASTKQKSNTQSSTESEIIGVDDFIPVIFLRETFEGSGPWCH